MTAALGCVGPYSLNREDGEGLAVNAQSAWGAWVAAVPVVPKNFQNTSKNARTPDVKFEARS
jgi:hypothetical protein